MFMLLFCVVPHRIVYVWSKIRDLTYFQSRLKPLSHLSLHHITLCYLLPATSGKYICLFKSSQILKYVGDFYDSVSIFCFGLYWWFTDELLYWCLFKDTIILLFILKEFGDYYFLTCRWKEWRTFSKKWGNETETQM